MKSGILSLASTAFTVIALALILLIPLYSIRSDPNHLSTLQFATIDASATKVKIGDDEYVGLPDPYDFSKHKQIYHMYLMNYCSGYKKPGSDKTVIDFCSKNGHELWDILSTWMMWGVSVKSDGSAKFEWLRRGPNWLWIVYIVATIMLGLSILGGFAKLYRWRRAKWVLLGISTATSSALLIVAIACQVTYGALVARADDDKVSITAYMGKAVYAVNWLAFGCSLISSVLVFVLCRRAPESGPNRIRANLGKMSSQNTSYKYESFRGEGGLKAGPVGHTRSVSVDRLPLRDPSTESLVGESRGRDQERRYDPYLSARGNPDLRVHSASLSRSPSRERLNSGRDQL